MSTNTLELVSAVGGALFLITLYGVFVVFKAIFKNYKTYRAIKLNNEKFMEKEKAREEMKANGNHHEWITMFVQSKERHVCKKTGYCPDIEGYIPMFQIELFLEYKKAEKEFEDFKAIKIKEMAAEYSLSEEQIDEIIEKVYSLKKDFSIKKMEDSIKNLQIKDESKSH